jgi:hypothetical protein
MPSTAVQQFIYAKGLNQMRQRRHAPKSGGAVVRVGAPEAGPDVASQISPISANRFAHMHSRAQADRFLRDRCAGLCFTSRPPYILAAHTRVDPASHPGQQVNPFKERDMALSGHLAALEAKHAELETRITSETQRPLPDDIALAQLKRAKLKVKEELNRLLH